MLIAAVTLGLFALPPSLRSSSVDSSVYLAILFGDPVQQVEHDTCDGTLAIRFIIGRDFAVTRSSPESC